MSKKIDDRNLGILKLMKMGLITTQQGESRFIYKHKSKRLREKYIKDLLIKLPKWDNQKEEVTNGQEESNEESVEEPCTRDSTFESYHDIEFED